jgi:nucleoside-diphosphate-sugar epimerase
LTVLVTGGAGFIGSNLVRELVALGEHVVSFDNLSTGSATNLEGVDGRLDLVTGDIRDASAVRRAARGAKAVFHLAALGSVERSIGDPFTSHAVNVDGTLNALVAAREEGAERFIYASSSSVYGNASTLPKDESMAVATLSPYAASKLGGESYCRAFYQSYDLGTVCLRLFNVFGPRQDPKSRYAAVIPSFITAISEGRAPEIHGDGRQSRDFTYVDNVVSALIQAASASGPALGEVINIGGGGRISLLELLGEVNMVMGTSARPVFRPRRHGDVDHSQAAIKKARRLIGYSSPVTFADGLAKTVNWFTSQRKTSVALST